MIWCFTYFSLGGVLWGTEKKNGILVVLWDDYDKYEMIMREVVKLIGRWGIYEWMTTPWKKG